MSLFEFCRPVIMTMFAMLWSSCPTSSSTEFFERFLRDGSYSTARSVLDIYILHQYRNSNKTDCTVARLRTGRKSFCCAKGQSYSASHQEVGFSGYSPNMFNIIYRMGKTCANNYSKFPGDFPRLRNTLVWDASCM